MPDLDGLRTFLLCSLGTAYTLLMVWFVVFVFLHDAVYRLHTRWFRLSVEAFDALNYGGMALFKIGSLTLFAIPWLASWCL